MSPDIIIIGAGAAGLAAAHELARARCSVLILEARDRIGGRCWTRNDPDLAAPIEYGAEFIHGQPVATLSLLRRFGVAKIERKGTRWLARDGQIVANDRAELFESIVAGMRVAGTPPRDLPFSAYLERWLDPHLSADASVMARRMVEGYDAVDPDRASAQAIIAEWTRESGPGHDRTFRPQHGYGPVLAAVAATFNKTDVRLQMQSVVRAITWKRARVEVEGTRFGRAFRVRARRLIVTLPLGVLQQSLTARPVVRFSPALDAKREALALLASGAALRVVLRYRQAFWATLDHGRYRNAGFFHAPQAQFPTFWTAVPDHAPLLVAWAGGPRAQRLSLLSPAAIIRRSIASVRTLFGNHPQIEVGCEGAFVHNWQRDRYARGAYSYVLTGGMQARRRLAQPLRGTLYFAGEATDDQGEAATVAGALQSGVRAAREVLAGFGHGAVSSRACT